MGFLADAFGGSRYGPPSSMSQDGWFVRMLGGGATDAGVAVSEYGALHLPAVYACVNRISNPIALFPLKIFERKDNGGAEQVMEHPLSSKLGLRPNPFMSSRTLRKTVSAHALLWGNGRLEIERQANGTAVGLWPLLPDRTTTRKLEDRIVHDTTIDGKTYRLDHDDVIHVMDLSHDGYVGMSQVALARQSIGWGLAMEKFGSKFFANDAKSGGFLTHPGRLSPQAHSNLRGPDGRGKAAAENPASALEAQGGLDNAHRVKVLEEGMKFHQTTIPPDDAQFLGSREFQTAEIARIFDVPLVLLQSHEKSTSWGSGIEQLMIGFVRQTIGPWVDAWEQELNWKLFTEAEREAGLYVKFNMNALLRGDSAARAAFYKAMFEVAGFSPNLILALEEMEGIGPAGDTHFVPANFVPLEAAIKGPAAPKPPPPEPPEQPE